LAAPIFALITVWLSLINTPALLFPVKGSEPAFKNSTRLLLATKTKRTATSCSYTPSTLFTEVTIAL
jgi:hypothetical protein